MWYSKNNWKILMEIMYNFYLVIMIQYVIGGLLRLYNISFYMLNYKCLNVKYINDLFLISCNIIGGQLGLKGI